MSSNTLYNVIVCAIIQNQDGKILLTRRKSNKKLGGKWEFPGGKLEHGEELHNALHREIQEELAIQIGIKKLLHIKPYTYEHGSVLILFYLCDYKSGEIELVDHDQMKWINPNEIELEKDLLPANQEVILLLKNK